MVKVFDLDGTLLDSNGIWRWVDETFLHQHGHKLTDEYNAYVSHAIFPDAAHFTKVYYNLPITEAEIMDGWLALAKECLCPHFAPKARCKGIFKAVRRQSRTNGALHFQRALSLSCGITKTRFNGIFFTSSVCTGAEAGKEISGLVFQTEQTPEHSAQRMRLIRRLPCRLPGGQESRLDSHRCPRSILFTSGD